MTPVDQDVFGVKGNCLSACIASIAELELAQMRDFEEFYLRAMLALETGRAVPYEVHAAHLIEIHRLGWHVQPVVRIVPAGYSIVSGPGPRGIEHACVALDGEISHDPHPTRHGLQRQDTYELVIPIIRSIAWILR